MADRCRSSKSAWPPSKGRRVRTPGPPRRGPRGRPREGVGLEEPGGDVRVLRRAGEGAGARRRGGRSLASFVAQYPGHKLVPNALYWKGESYYSEKDYENAILAFQDVVDKYPSGEKAPDAVYKQGLSFLALKDKKNAKILFNLVVSKYPKSPAAGMAKKKLTELK